MKKTITVQVDNKKNGKIAADMISQLVTRDDLTIPDIIAVGLNFQTYFNLFLEQEGITVNNIVRKY